MDHLSTVPVALVDDHTLMRSALARLIDRLPGYQVVLEAENGLDYQRRSPLSPKAAIAVVDLHMPVMDGYATIAWLHQHQPETRVLALTFERSEEAMLRALRAGACGFVLKDVKARAFKTALDHVAVLGHYHDHDLEVELHRGSEARLRYDHQRAHVLSQLSERELEFIRLTCHENEYTYDVIAERMKVHRRTLDGYREAIFGKFGLKSKVGLVLFAFKWHLATP